MERVAIVTGGSRGRGREVARELAARGYAVVVGYADGQRDADAAVEEILAAGGAAVAIRADLVDALDVDRLFDETVEAFGGIDLVVHAAAGTRSVVDARAARHAPEAVAVVDAGQRDQGSPGGERRPGGETVTASRPRRTR